MTKKDLFLEITYSLLIGFVIIGVMFSPYTHEELIYWVYGISLLCILTAAYNERQKTYYAFIFLAIIIPFVPLFYTRILFGLDENTWPIEMTPFFQFQIVGQIAWLTITLVTAYIGNSIGKWKSMN